MAAGQLPRPHSLAAQLGAPAAITRQADPQEAPGGGRGQQPACTNLNTLISLRIIDEVSLGLTRNGNWILAASSRPRDGRVAGLCSLVAGPGSRFQCPGAKGHAFGRVLRFPLHSGARIDPVGRHHARRIEYKGFNALAAVKLRAAIDVAADRRAKSAPASPSRRWCWANWSPVELARWRARYRRRALPKTECNNGLTEIGRMAECTTKKASEAGTGSCTSQQ